MEKEIREEDERERESIEIEKCAKKTKLKTAAEPKIEGADRIKAIQNTMKRNETLCSSREETKESPLRT